MKSNWLRFQLSFLFEFISLMSVFNSLCYEPENNLIFEYLAGSR